MSDGLHWKEMKTEMVSIDSVHVVERILHPTKTRIEAMAKSLSGLGQLQAILIRKNLQVWDVVAGATRLLAAKELGWHQIKATIIAADNDFEYGLIEIAENVDRHDLSDTERDRLKAKDKELRAKRLAQFEAELAAAPPVKAKGGRGKKGGVADAARKAGVPLRTARRRKKETSAKSQSGTSLDKRIKDPVIAVTKDQAEKRKAEEQSQKMVKCPMCHGKGEIPRVGVFEV